MDTERGPLLLSENESTNPRQLGTTSEDVTQQDVHVSFPKQNGRRGNQPNQIKTSKYTWYSFLPKNIFEQLHKFGNCYFLLISFIMYLGEKTPLYVGTIKAFSTIGVLVMMMAVSATMALLDDLRRTEADREINKSLAQHWSGGQKTVGKHWEDVEVGDILIIREDEEFPADIVPFYCSGEGGNCYVSTANLDGETNLKLKSATEGLQGACTPSNNNYNPENRKAGVEQLENEVLKMIGGLEGIVVAEAPNSNIHDFKGSLSLKKPREFQESLGAQQILLRGTKLRNTALVAGIVIYCGGDTRMIRNSRPAPAKISSLEYFTNNSMKLILIAQGCLALLSSICFSYNKWYFAGLWYIHLPDVWLWDIPAYWLTFFTLYSNLMPISLYPTTEFCNAMQSFFIRNDKHMVYKAEDFDNGVPFAARARSSNLCQELGQIKYLFSDKTGTLTQNVMELKRLSVGKKYGHLIPLEVGFNGKVSLKEDRGEGCENAARIESFLEVLAVAHTVMVSKGEDGKLSYEAESPDEHALVKAASDLGWSFESRKGNTVMCEKVSIAGVRQPKPKKKAKKASASTVPDEQERTTEGTTEQLPEQQHTEQPSEQHSQKETRKEPTSTFPLCCVGSTISEPFAAPDSVERAPLTPPPVGTIPKEELPQLVAEDKSVPSASSLAAAAAPPPPPLPEQPVLVSPPAKTEGAQPVGHQHPPTRSCPARLVTNKEPAASSPCETITEEVTQEVTEEIIEPQPFKVPPGGTLSHSYTIEATNTFTSSRKRMSIVVQKDNAEYLLFVKGADNVMLDRASKGVDYKQLKDDLNEFSREGLRTLVIGQKKLDPKQVKDWLNDYEEAQRKTNGREEALEQVAEKMETDIEIVGATAIEDKLQDQVPETIQKIRTAGIKLWVLTGDKLETARNIGFATKVLVDGMNIQTLDNGEEGEGGDLSMVAEGLQKDAPGRALMVTGKALTDILGHPRKKQDFLEVAQKCDVLIACRVSPKQKAELVRLIREAAPPGQEPVTAAIGDGANDVPMIQEAQVGIGIAGREGRQSVNNSDFAIGQFQYLQRLLFIHGRWNYLRACKFTLFTFWRNMVQVLIMFAYTFFSGFSGTVLFEDWLRLTFNGFGTLPVLAVGAFDQDVRADVALENPQLYVVGREGHELNVTKTLHTFVAAVVHASIIVIVNWMAYPGMDLWGAGDYYTFGSAVYTCLIIGMTYRVAFLTCSHNRYTLGIIAFTLGGYVFFLLVYPCVSFMANIFEPNMYMVPAYMVSNASFWICIFAIPMIGWSIDSFTSWAKHMFWPDAVDKIKAYDGQVKEEPPSDEDQDHIARQSLALELDVDCSRYGQQELKSWRIETTPLLTLKITCACGIALLLTGMLVKNDANNAAQLRMIYQMATQGQTMLASELPWGTLDNEVFVREHCDAEPGTNDGNLTCHATVPRNMRPPLLVYYGVGPFYQNMVSYIKSEVPKELMGKKVDDAARAAKCREENSRERDGMKIVPCGTKATSLFNDTLELSHRNGKVIKINKKGVAWNSDFNRYNNPEDYLKRPDTKWLYELFPNVVKKMEGVKNEAFAAWMRPSALGRVWNHYGWVEEQLNMGDNISFQIKSSFDATAESSKMFVITERKVFGGRHTYLGILLMTAGSSCIFLSLIVCLGQGFSQVRASSSHVSVRG